MNLLTIKNLEKTYSNGTKALERVNLLIEEGKCFGIVGESGCGKSTLAKIITGLEEPSAGKIFLKKEDITANAIKQNIQMIFQNPLSSLNPRKKIWKSIAESLLIKKIKRRKAKESALKMMTSCGLPKEYCDKYPHQLSGGQCQRVAIARALISKPKLIVCDEPTSALDVTIQAQILNLLIRLQDQFQLTYIFISHDLSVIHHICDTIAVMHFGKVVEIEKRDKIFNQPQHQYTQKLLSSNLEL